MPYSGRRPTNRKSHNGWTTNWVPLNSIDVDPDSEETAWELYGKRHGYMACLPRGRVRVVRHDLPDSDDANILNNAAQPSAGSARQTH